MGPDFKGTARFKGDILLFRSLPACEACLKRHLSYGLFVCCSKLRRRGFSVIEASPGGRNGDRSNKTASVTSTGALPASISVLSEMRSDDEVEAVACKIGAVDKFDFTLRYP